MTLEHFNLAPPGGWSSFTHSVELEALVSEHLLRDDFGGIWRYYGFTSDTAIWSSDTSPNSYLCLSFAGYPSEAPSHFDDVCIALSHDQSEHYQQLSALVNRLTVEFGLREVPSDTTPTPDDREGSSHIESLGL